MEIKETAFAGTWYPGSAGECDRAISDFLAQGGPEGAGVPKGGAGGIVPHAGWVYSGKIACRVMAALAECTPHPDTIVLFGAHMHRSSPAFVLASGGVATPLGAIMADEDLAESMTGELARAGHRVQSLSPFSFPDENTLELQYPFIRHFFPGSRLLAWGVPPTDLAAKIGEAAVDGAKALGREILVIGSTDMTHYGPNFGFEPAGTGEAAVDWVKKDNDARAIRALGEMDARAIIDQGLSSQNMCCAGAAAAAAAACKKKGAAKGFCLDYATSCDISRASSFVGYCGMVFA